MTKYKQRDMSDYDQREGVIEPDIILITGDRSMVKSLWQQLADEGCVFARVSQFDGEMRDGSKQFVLEGWKTKIMADQQGEPRFALQV